MRRHISTTPFPEAPYWAAVKEAAQITEPPPEPDIDWQYSPLFAPWRMALPAIQQSRSLDDQGSPTTGGAV